MGRELIRFALYLVVFFIVLTLYTKTVGPLPFSVNSVTTTKTTTFDVTGEGRVTVAPDTANVSAGVSATGSTVKEVQDKMNAAINKVSASIKNLGIESKDIKTSNYNVNPIYGESQRITGYSANTNLSIKVRDIKKVNAVIDSAIEAGATNVSNLGLTVSERSVFENEARKKAVEEAKKKAENAAKTAGFMLGKIVNYSESFADFPPPLALSLEVKDRGQTNIEPGENEIVVTVTLSYEIK